MITDCYIYDIQNNKLSLIYNRDNCESIKIDKFNRINELNLICYMERFEYDESKKIKLMLLN